METFALEKIITISVLCVWFLFPLGMLVSFMYQDKHQKYPKITEAHKKKHPPEYHRNFVVNEVDEDGEYQHHEVVLPKIPAHQIPRNPDHFHSNWKS